MSLNHALVVENSHLELKPEASPNAYEARWKALRFLQCDTVQAEKSPRVLGIGILPNEIDPQLDGATHWRDLPQIDPGNRGWLGFVEVDRLADFPGVYRKLHDAEVEASDQVQDHSTRLVLLRDRELDKVAHATTGHEVMGSAAEPVGMETQMRHLPMTTQAFRLGGRLEVLHLDRALNAVGLRVADLLRSLIQIGQRRDRPGSRLGQRRTVVHGQARRSLGPSTRCGPTANSSMGLHRNRQ
jgi:hypothetical protein